MATDLPLHTLAAAAPLNYMPVTVGGVDGDESTEPLTDSNLQSGTIALPLIGQNSLTQQNASAEAPVASYDFGFKADPLAVTLRFRSHERGRSNRDHLGNSVRAG